MEGAAVVDGPVGVAFGHVGVAGAAAIVGAEVWLESVMAAISDVAGVGDDWVGVVAATVDLQVVRGVVEEVVTAHGDGAVEQTHEVAVLELGFVVGAGIEEDIAAADVVG